MRNVLLGTLAMLALVGCESDFDKCFTAEQEKAKAAALVSHPILATFAKIDKVPDRQAAYYRALATAPKSIELSDADWDCIDSKDPCAEAAEQKLEQKNKEFRDHMDGSGLADIEPLMVELRRVTEVDFEGDKDFANRLSQWAINRSKTKKMPDSKDIDALVAYRIDDYKAWREFWWTELKVDALIAKAPDVAKEVCNSRGLYE